MSRAARPMSLRFRNRLVMALTLLIGAACQSSADLTATPPSLSTGIHPAPGTPTPLPEPNEPTSSAVLLPPGPTPTQEPPLREVRVLQTEAAIHCLDWSLDGARLAAGHSNDSVVVWDAATGERILDLQHDSWPESCEWSPLGDRIAVGTIGKVYIWDATTGELERTLVGHFGWINRLAWSPDGSMVAALGSVDKSARTWDVERGEPLHALPSADGTYDLDWSPDGTAVATATGGGVKIWEVSSGKLISTLKTTDGARTVRWSPDGLALLASTWSGIAAWEIIEGRSLGPYLPEGRPPSAALWSPDGNMVAAGDVEGPLRIWDAQSGDLVLSSSGSWGRPWRWIDGLAWSPDSTLLAGIGGGYYDDANFGRIFLWRLDERNDSFILETYIGVVLELAWSPDGNTLASGAADGRVILWGSP